ncbi:MAG: tetratricopeptide repeat protein [Flavobacteriales bacterium]|nr:tetratricopeptide repeat protein [Flavobacteriales bacterium]
MGNFHPVSLLSLAFDSWIGGGSHVTFHVTNVLLHALNAVLVFLITVKLLTSRLNAAVVAVLFAVHPIHVEGVAWIAERKNVLYVLFFLAACVRYIRFMEKPGRWIMFQVLLLFLAAVLSKAQAITLPLALVGITLLHEGWGDWRKRTVQLLPFFLVSLIFAVVAISAQKSGGYLHWERGAVPQAGYLLAPVVFMTLIRRVILPTDLSVIHPLLPAGSMATIVCLFLLIGMLLLMIALFRKGKYPLVAVFILYAAAVLPILQLVPVGSMLTSDRYAYLASVPVIAICVQGVSSLGVPHKYALPIWVSCAAVLITMTWSRVQYWCTPMELFKQAVALYPNSEVAHMNLAGQFIRASELDAAEEHLGRALSIDPNLVEALITAGQLDLRKGRSTQALAKAERAIAIAPDYRSIHLAYLTQALVLKGAGRPKEALKSIALGLMHDPENATLYHEQGICQAMLGNHRLALSSYTKAISLGDTDQTLLINLAISQGWLGENEAALQTLEKVLTMAPVSPEAWFLKGVALDRTGRSGCKELFRAKELGHPNAQAALIKLCTSGVGP